MSERNCQDCGRPLVMNVRGRPPIRCGECLRGRRRVKERAAQTCVDCGASFVPEGHTGRPSPRCNSCRVVYKKRTDAEKSRRWRAADPERQKRFERESYERRKAAPDYAEWRRANGYKYKYGITPADYDRMLAEQGGVCAICRGPHRGVGKRFHVDHCHDSSRVRGLLCGNCNTFIGLADHSPDRLREAIAYLGDPM